jgi:hypothetical protein
MASNSGSDSLKKPLIRALCVLVWLTVAMVNGNLFGATQQKDIYTIAFLATLALVP